jgi:hypothetical protein
MNSRTRCAARYSGQTPLVANGSGTGAGHYHRLGLAIQPVGDVFGEVLNDKRLLGLAGGMTSTVAARLAALPLTRLLSSSCLERLKAVL